MRIDHAYLALKALTQREGVKFLQQKGRLFSAFVRPALWLFVFAVGFRGVYGVDAGEPYLQRSVNYEYYILPGLTCMVLLFSGMQSSLAMVYDREMGVMRLLLTAPLPRWYLLTAKLLSGTVLSVIQAYGFLLICLPFAWFTGLRVAFNDPLGWLYVFPALILTGMMLGALGLLLSVHIKQLENFAGTMNFVIFPMFFISPALFPLWYLQESGADLVYWIASVNPFTYGVQLVRYASEGQFYGLGAVVVCACTVGFLALAVVGYDPQRGFVKRGPKPA
ncbi:MAG: ABC transporter permease [Alphaproteobacteria bacterium]|jgi:ABC-2 type transport system permease protein|nr:ABC transporter permease [Alphaproteobacteria bacterium]MDP6516978.1 ABC transporter permease [Alphaproteobacteria bacterium]